MNLIRKKLQFISLFMASLILFTSCEQYDIETNEVIVSEEDINGKELFTTLFFGSESAKIDINHVREINQMRSSLEDEQLTELNDLTQKIIKKIEYNDANFFKNFKKNIYSKNHYLIEEVIEKSGKLIEKSMLEIPEIRDKYLFSVALMKNIDINEYIDSNDEFNKEKFISDVELEYGDDIGSWITPMVFALAVAVIIVQTVGLAISYWVGVFVTIKFPEINKDGTLGSNASKLQKEILVNDIYETF